MAQEKEYFAFISYQRKDEEWADRLRSKLEHYRLPSSVRKQDASLPKEIRPIFRDALELAGGVLAKEIEAALQQSKFLIVICSPNSAKSPWVNKEIQTFIDLGREDRIIPFIIDGTPFSDDEKTECFPPALRSLKDERELLGININELSRDAAAVKVVARMFGLKFDSLWQRYEREKKKRIWMGILGLVLFGVVCLGVASYIAQKNVELEKQHDLLFKSKLYQDISMSKAYLAQQRPEMSLIIMNEIESNIERLDSIKLLEYKQMKQSLCDSILNSPVLLVDVQESAVRAQSNPNNIPENNGILEVNVQSDGAFDCECAYIHNTKANTTDTICGISKIIFKANQGQTYIALYAESGYETTDLDTIYSQEKTGIRIYSLKTGEVRHFVCCSGWLSWMTYPMGLSNDGDYLVYREGSRAHESIWFMDYKIGERTILQNWYSNSSEKTTSAFSPNDRFFFISYPDKNEIIIYSSQSKKKLHTFRYENYDDVFWDESNNICISSNGKIYVWKLYENKHNYQFQISTYANGVTISDNKQYAAAACDNGIIYIWDIPHGEILFEKEIMIAPMDVAFSKDNKSLWVISGYNGISTIDIESKGTNDIYEDSDLVPHPWPAYLYMTKNGKHCISICTYGEKYTLFDMKGTLLDCDRDKSRNTLFSEFEYPEKFDFDPTFMDIRYPELTARRLSQDGEMCIEGYSNGIIKIASVKEKETIESLIGNKTK